MYTNILINCVLSGILYFLVWGLGFGALGPWGLGSWGRWIGSCCHNILVHNSYLSTEISDPADRSNPQVVLSFVSVLLYWQDSCCWSVLQWPDAFVLPRPSLTDLRLSMCMDDRPEMPQNMIALHTIALHTYDYSTHMAISICSLYNVVIEYGHFCKNFCAT